MEPTLATPAPRLYELDLLRFVAALSVMLYHYTYRYTTGAQNPVAFKQLGQLTRYGYLGVQLFFLISGYVVLRSAQGKTVRQFIVSRAVRLYPAFWVACTLTFVVGRLWGPAFSFLRFSAGQYLGNMTLLSGFLTISYIDGVYWSLTLELIFYFLVSLLLAYRLLPRLDLFISLWLSYVVLAGLRIAAPHTLLSALLLPEHAPYFAAGMLFYLLQQPQGRTWRRYTLLAACYLLAVRASVLQASDMVGAFRGTIRPGVLAILITCFFGALYLISSQKISWRQAGLARLGALTYPLYLLHGSIGFVVFYHASRLVNKYLLLGGLVVLMVGAAYGLHVLIEKPLGKALGTFLAKRLLPLDALASRPAG
jgi:peptidoglycan/LPS O-acetylase OafA/YrhL